MNRISIIGCGYVGLVIGACGADQGSTVICMDSDVARIESLEQGLLPFYEPGLEDIVARNRKAGRLRFVSDIKQATNSSEIIVFALGTPSLPDGNTDISSICEAAEAVASHMENAKTIIVKSTVPMGTNAKIHAIFEKRLKERGLDLPFDIVSNPEFLAEGSAIANCLHPSRVVIGTQSASSRRLLQSLYSSQKDTSFIFTDPISAELSKYACNAFLACKIAFIGELAQLCDSSGADIAKVSEVMGQDPRIGPDFLNPGPGYGGSCFPKDTASLAQVGISFGRAQHIVESVISSNLGQMHYVVDRIEKQLGFLEKKRIACLGLSFKEETSDIRESASIVVIRELLARSAFVTAFDPVAMKDASALLKSDSLRFAIDEYDAAAQSDAIVILTPWKRFACLDWAKLGSIMREKTCFDFRNILDAKALKAQGFLYFGLGRS